MYGSRKLVLMGTVFRFVAFIAFMSMVINAVAKGSLFLLYTSLILIIFGIGMGITNAPLYSLIIDKFRQEETSTISGIYDTFRYLSSSIGVVVFSQILRLVTGFSSDVNIALFVSLSVGTLLIFIGFLAINKLPKEFENGIRHTPRTN